MKTSALWSTPSYHPPLWDAGSPVIVRIAPAEDSIHLEWLPEEEAGEYRVLCAPRGEEMREAGRTRECAFDLTGLADQTDYALQVRWEKGKSRVRLARTGKAVGTVVNYLHPEDDCYAFSGRYLCSPSLLRQTDGSLLASMDLFAPGAPQNLTLLFRSDDDGKSWHSLCQLMPCFWGRLFLHQSHLYMLACSTEYGDLLIGRSDDGGKTFCAPVALLRGSGRCDVPGVHKNPQPPVIFGGRIWETLEWGAWACGGHAAMVMSADVRSDLMNPESWTFSEPLPYDPAWRGTASGFSAGCIEGSLTVTPEGELVNIMRYDMTRAKPCYGRALVFRVDTDRPEAPLSYSRAMNFDANHSKFEIRFDPVSGCYFSIASRILSPENRGSRNLLSLMVSRDLKTWSAACDLMDFRLSDPGRVGFQYVDFFFEGDDILFLCRTALNGAHNYHDANYSTFHRVANFRRYAL